MEPTLHDGTTVLIATTCLIPAAVALVETLARLTRRVRRLEARMDALREAREQPPRPDPG